MNIQLTEVRFKVIAIVEGCAQVTIEMQDADGRTYVIAPHNVAAGDASVVIFGSENDPNAQNLNTFLLPNHRN